MDGVTRAQRRQLERENNNRGGVLELVPIEQWPRGMLNDKSRTRVWRSGRYLVQEFAEADGVVRLSINRASISGNRWIDQISWEELQQIKNELGFFAHCAVEVYPPLLDEVNVANMRHLWILAEPPAFMWRSRRIGDPA